MPPPPVSRAAAARSHLGGLRCVLVVLLFAIVTAWPAAAAPAFAGSKSQDGGGTIGLRLVEVPTATADDPRAQHYIVDHLAPGTVIQRKIEVSNNTAAPLDVALYPSAASIADGSFMGADGHTPNDLTTWTSVSPDTTSVPANGASTATVTVTVPADAAPGEQYGVVWAEAASAAPSGSGMKQVSRVGIRVYLSVGPGNPPASNFVIDTLAAHRSAEGLPTVVASVHNTGGRALDLAGTLQLSAGPGGLTAGPFPVTLGTTVGIGETEPAAVVLDKSLPAGPWDAAITLKSGLLEVSEHATITFPDTGEAAPVAAVPVPIPQSSTPAWLLPAVVVLAVLLIGVAVLLVFVLRRRRT